MLRCNIGNQFLDKNGLSYTSSTEQTDFSTFLIWAQKVNNLDTCLQHLCLCCLLFKAWSFSVNRCVFNILRSLFFINRLTQYVEDTSECCFANRN